MARSKNLPNEQPEQGNESALPRAQRRLASALAESKAEFAFSMALVGLPGRLKAVVDLFSTQREAAAFIGRSPVTLQNWAKGAEPTFSDVAKLAVDKGVSLKWLATGEGQMLEGSAALEEFAYIPRLEMRPGVTSVHGELVDRFVSFRRDWIRDRLRCDPNDLLVVEMGDDSMRPTIDVGDLALFDSSRTEASDDGIYVVLAGNRPVLKRVELNMDGSLEVKSDNRNYRAHIYLPNQVDELRVLGKVVWTGGIV